MGRRAAGGEFGTIESRRQKNGKTSHYAKYTARLADPEGGHYSKRFTAPYPFPTKAAARHWLNDCQKAILSGEWTENYGRAVLAPKGVTMKELYDSLSKDRIVSGKWGNSTQTRQRSDWAHHVEPYWSAGREVSTITRKEVDDWRLGPLAGRRAIDVRVWTLFRSMIRYALQTEVIEKDPTIGMSVTPKPRKEKLGFTVEEMGSYLEHCQPRDRALLGVMILGGLRSQEARALRRIDVDLDKGVLHVRQAAEDWRDEDGKYHTDVKAPKSAAGTRDVPVPEVLVEILRNHLKHNPRIGKAFMFVDADGSLLSKGQVDGAHRRTLKAMGLREGDRARRKLSPEERKKAPGVHDLRASWATDLAASGQFAQADLMKIGGWSTPNMVNVYSRVSEERLRAAATLLDRQLAGLKLAGTD